jgi:alkylhydroperoxidase/carboxymuconolactone decarboxylase family protein YurZ
VLSYYGFIPRIYQELRHNQAALKTCFYKNKQLTTDVVLPSLTKEFIAIGSAAALGSEHCLDTLIEGAKRLNADDDQIFLAILLGPRLQKLRRYPNHCARAAPAPPNLM